MNRLARLLTLRPKRRKAARRRAVAIWSGGLTGIGALALGATFTGVATGTVMASCFVALLAWLAIADRALMRRPGGISCLTWHSVSEDAAWLPWADAISVRPATLDRQLALLRRMGCRPMDTVEFCRRRRAGEAVPRDTILLHFDDGYLDNWVAAAPFLARHEMRATLFVSLDFVAPDRPERLSLADADNPPEWAGYLTWREIARLDSGAFGGVFDIQPHGVDHGRVPTGPRIVDRLTRANWRGHAWVQWAATPGNKHDWYRADSPVAAPLGTPVPESGTALEARAWRDGRLESEAEYAARVRAELATCRAEFEARLGKRPALFCWPQNRTSAIARRIAAEEGYLATTGGLGANRIGEPAGIVSRVHVGERMAGIESAWLDDLGFRATVRCFQGNHYWYLALIALGLLARLARLRYPARRRPLLEEATA